MSSSRGVLPWLVVVACCASCGGIAGGDESAVSVGSGGLGGSGGAPIDASGESAGVPVDASDEPAAPVVEAATDGVPGADGETSTPLADASIDVPADAIADAPRPRCRYEALPPVDVRLELWGQPRTWNGNGYATTRAVIQTGGYYGNSMFALRWAHLDAFGAFLGEEVAFDFRVRNPDTGLMVDLGSAATRAIGMAGDGYGIVWYENDLRRLQFAFLDSAGHGQGDPVVLADGLVSYVGAASLLWNGTAVAAVFDMSRGLVFMTIDRSGQVSAPVTSVQPIALIGELEMFRRGDGYLIFYENFHQALDELRVARLDGAGQLVGETVGLTDPSSYLRRPLLVPALGGYVGVWSEQPNHVGGVDRTVMKRFDGEGTVVDERTIFTQPSALAWSGEDFGVIIYDGEAIRFGVLDEQGELQPETIEIARDYHTDAGTYEPTISSFDWHGDRFGLFYSFTEGGAQTTKFRAFVCRR
jgi:hypothetical protein